MNITDQIIRNSQFFCCFKQFIFPHICHTADLSIHFPHVTDSLNDITGAGFAFCTDHCSTFLNSAESFAQVSCTANKGNFELMLVDVIKIICGRKNFAFVDVINFDRLKNLSFCKVSDPAFCHNRNGNSFLDSFDHFRIAHSGNTAGCADICGNPFQCHDCTCTCIFSDPCLFGGCDIHNDSAFQHLGKITVQFCLSCVHKKISFCFF